MAAESPGSVSWKRVIRWGTGIGLLAALSRASGLFRETTIGYRFGVTANLDVYYLASAVPLFLAWIGDFTANQTMLPLFAKAHEGGQRDSAWRQASGTLWLCILSLSVLGLFAYVGAPLIWSIVGRKVSPELSSMAIFILRISVPIMIVQTVGGWQAGILQARRKFYTPAAVPLAFNAAVVFALLIGAPRWGVYALAFGMLLAEIVRAGIQMVGLRTLGLRIHHLVHPDMQMASSCLTHLLPIALAAVFHQLIFYSDRIMAGSLPDGCVSALVYGQRILILPQSFLVAVWAIPIYSLLAESVAKKDFAQASRWVNSGLRTLSALALPISLILFCLSENIIDIVFRRGAFDAEASTLAGAALRGYAFALVFWVSTQQLSQYSYALGRPKLPLVALLVGCAGNLLLNTLLVRFYSHAGLAYSTSAAYALSLLVLALLLRKRAALTLEHWRRTLTRNLVAALGMAGILLLGKRVLQGLLSSGDPVMVLPTLAALVLMSSLGYLVIWKAIRE